MTTVIASLPEIPVDDEGANQWWRDYPEAWYDDLEGVWKISIEMPDESGTTKLKTYTVTQAVVDQFIALQNTPYTQWPTEMKRYWSYDHARYDIVPIQIGTTWIASDIVLGGSYVESMYTPAEVVADASPSGWQGVVGHHDTYAATEGGYIDQYGVFGALALGLYDPHETAWYDTTAGQIGLWSIAAMWGVAGAVAGASVGAAVWSATPGVLTAAFAAGAAGSAVAALSAATVHELLPDVENAAGEDVVTSGLFWGTVAGTGLVLWSQADSAINTLFQGPAGSHEVEAQINAFGGILP